MTAVDRIIEESWAMQDYIDAQAGGEGEGWFRVVSSPAEAREVIAAGKLAVVLGIEASDLFRCTLTQRPDGPVCDAAYVDAQLDEYYARGVRAVFPNHKYDNRFSPGDGSGDFIELGNFFNSGHWTNKTQDCPDDGMPEGFDGGRISFGDLASPREEYLSAPPNDFSDFPDAPLETALEFTPQILGDSLEGRWCQNATLTDVGEALFAGMMARGMIIEVDHLPMWSYRRAFEILEANDYPAAGTHGRDWDGRIYAVGGISTVGLGRCQDATNPGSTLAGVSAEAALITANGGYPGTPFGFDLNGFAGSAGPRFTEGACGTVQEGPITYPFTSYAGDVTFTEPQLGTRTVDFNTEGMVHIGMLPELLEDARHDAVSDADLEPLFRSAEAWIRMWEKAETRSLELGGG
jgi:microsomal dipeptidase-like Zn-dependent dipeptidase